MRLRVLIVATALVLALTAFPAFADTTTFTIDYNGNPSVYSAINGNGGFYVSSDSANGQFLNGNASGGSAYTTGSSVFAGGLNYANAGGGYSDAGLVVFFNGGLTLGELENVSVTSSGDPVAINLWLDSGNDGSFFTFAGSQFSSLNGDTYAGCGAPALTLSSSCFIFGGNGAGNSFTLADLQNGAVMGIDGSTRAAIWVGVTHPDGGASQFADITSISVTTTSPVPEPASMMMFGTGLASIAGVIRRKLKK